MDIATIAGIALCVVLVCATIVMGGDPIMFINIPSACVVVGGAVGATLVRNPLASVIGTFGVVGKAFSTKAPLPDQLIPQVIEMARTARKDLLALEKVEIEYGFLAKGIAMCVDGVKSDLIRAILETDMRATASRHKRGQEVLEGMGQAAPAFGMIGTLIGLVQMLATLEDPSAIGPAMAVALLTTLYGALISNVVCLPLADKLKVRSGEEVISMMVCLEGVIGIAQGSNPSAIDQQLKGFLAPKLRNASSGAPNEKEQSE